MNREFAISAKLKQSPCISVENFEEYVNVCMDLNDENLNLFLQIDTRAMKDFIDNARGNIICADDFNNKFRLLCSDLAFLAFLAEKHDIKSKKVF